MAEVTDPRGVRWSVRRRRWYDLSAWSMAGADFGLGTLVTIALLAGGWWPFWFVAHWLGVRWRIVIKHDGEELDDEYVRGWRRSQRRIREILESAAAGTLPQSFSAPA